MLRRAFVVAAVLLLGGAFLVRHLGQRTAAARPLDGALLSALAPEERALIASRDAVRFRAEVAQLRALRQHITDSAALFNRDKERGLSADERRDALTMFAAVLDHVSALEHLEQVHLDFWRLGAIAQPTEHARHFALFFAAYVEKLALALQFTDATLNRPQFERLLDEGTAGLSVPAGAYAKLKWNAVHVDESAKTLALHQWLKVVGPALARVEKDDMTFGFVRARLDEQYDAVVQLLTHRGVHLFGGNAEDIGKDAAHAVWFPLQAEVAEVMGDTRVKRVNQALIAAPQADEAARMLVAGDVLVERRNWYLSNVGLPGFWPHAALYLGDAQELAAATADPSVDAAYGEPLVAVLARRYPEAWNAFTAPDAEGHTVRILEAMSEGVLFTSVEHSIGTADYAAGMRPRLSKLDTARAIERAFSYWGRPYDFDFDFFTDASIVCSELVYKAYEPRTGCAGLTLPLERVVGRMTLGPNTIVRLFDEAQGTPAQQLDFVFFLDGSEQQHTAAFASLGAFRSSHKRPKWDVLQR